MQVLKRIVVTGAMGGIGVATLAGSGAFACSPQVGITVNAPGSTFAPNTVSPGDALEVKVTRFHEGGVIEITWNDPTLANAPVLVSAPIVDPSFANGTVLTVPFTVPANARPSAELPNAAGYPLVARQFNAERTEVTLSGSALLYVGGGTVPTSSAPTVVTPAPVVETPAPVVDTTPAPVVETPAPATVTNTPAPVVGTPAPATVTNTPAPVVGTPAPATVTNTPAPGRTSAAPSAVAAPAASNAAAATRPAASPTANALPAPTVLPGESLARTQPASGDLWSGLSADKAPSLLDGSAASDQGQSTPVGGILLAGGVLAMAGAALAVGRRRLAFSRTSR